jgi:hypothetical protein
MNLNMKMEVKRFLVVAIGEWFSFFKRRCQPENDPSGVGPMIYSYDDQLYRLRRSDGVLPTRDRETTPSRAVPVHGLHYRVSRDKHQTRLIQYVLE